MMELILHIWRATAPVGRLVHVLGLGERAAETHFSCPRAGPPTQPDQKARLRQPKPGTAICHSSGVTEEKGIKPPCDSSFEVRSADIGLYLADTAWPPRAQEWWIHLLWEGSMKDQFLSLSLACTLHRQDVAPLAYAIVPGNRLKLSEYLLQNINYSFRSTVNTLFSFRS